MYGLLDGVAGSPPTRSAREVLQELMSSLGSGGLRAAADNSRLLAAIDQHAAAIRDSLTAAVGAADGPPSTNGPAPDVVPEAAPADLTHAGAAPLSLASLAGYAEGIRETAMTHGWRPPTGPVAWSTAEGEDWILLRLLAVCALARNLGIESAPAIPPMRKPEGGVPPTD